MSIDKFIQNTTIGLIGLIIVLYMFKDKIVGNRIENVVPLRIRSFFNAQPQKHIELNKYKINENNKEKYSNAMEAFITINRTDASIKKKIVEAITVVAEPRPWYILDFIGLNIESITITLPTQSNQDCLELEEFAQLFSKILKIQAKKITIGFEQNTRKSTSLCVLAEVLSKIRGMEAIYLKNIKDIICKDTYSHLFPESGNSIETPELTVKIDTSIQIQAIEVLIQNSFKENSRLNIAKIYAYISSNHLNSEKTISLCIDNGLDYYLENGEEIVMFLNS
ncbi:hypothetical protein NEFER03_1453 [Nematocida sp. LUAm3]|nr:hypothetical protein NEFER03_1453 [Nematocida sp. LUAm3]KAI5174717.1 hypothetical protein NEFER02_0827 [Nematocida sp. LUAm2]KAI5177872.1 hypothetical protein NEFER01_1074 [Nematocida sp. LUAm1]